MEDLGVISPSDGGSRLSCYTMIGLSYFLANCCIQDGHCLVGSPSPRLHDQILNTQVVEMISQSTDGDWGIDPLARLFIYLL